MIMNTLNKKTLFFIALIAVQFIMGCKKKESETKIENAYTCSTCKATAEAKAEFNTSNKGVYKGVMVGSSGIIVFDVLNSGSVISANITVDNQTAILTSTTNPVVGETFTSSFTGVLNGQNISLNFTVNANGSNPVISSINIPGHLNAVFLLFKETSDNQIIGFEGTTDGVKDSGAKQSGQLNLVASTKTNTWSALSTNSGSTSINLATGTISGATYTCNCGPTTTAIGTLTGDVINGTYKGDDNHGTWYAKRTF